MAWKGFGDVVLLTVYDRYEVAPEDETQVPRVGDIGTLIRINMQEACGTGSNEEWYVLKADGTETTWTPTINGNYLEYTTIDGDFNRKGTYFITPYIEFP